MLTVLCSFAFAIHLALSPTSFVSRELDYKGGQSVMSAAAALTTSIHVALDDVGDTVPTSATGGGWVRNG